jgi:hypothetical protein
MLIIIFIIFLIRRGNEVRLILVFESDEQQERAQMRLFLLLASEAESYATFG